MARRPATDPVAYLVSWLRRDAAMRNRLLLAHEPDRHGRCRTCRSGGSGIAVRGCRLWAAALEADRLALADRRAHTDRILAALQRPPHRRARPRGA